MNGGDQIVVDRTRWNLGSGGAAGNVGARVTCRET